MASMATPHNKSLCHWLLAWVALALVRTGIGSPDSLSNPAKAETVERDSGENSLERHGRRKEYAMTMTLLFAGRMTAALWLFNRSTHFALGASS
jgi:hypothetical protein